MQKITISIIHESMTVFKYFCQHFFIWKFIALNLKLCKCREMQ